MIPTLDQYGETLLVLRYICAALAALNLALFLFWTLMHWGRRGTDLIALAFCGILANLSYGYWYAASYATKFNPSIFTMMTCLALLHVALIVFLVREKRARMRAGARRSTP